MTRCAIKLVPADWKDTFPLPFNKTTRDYGKVEAGMHVLVFQRDLGIVGDAIVQGAFIAAHDWTGDPLPPSLAQADYLLPLDAIYYHGKVIPLDAVRQILGDPGFPQLDGWRPIDAQTYHQLIRRLL